MSWVGILDGPMIGYLTSCYMSQGALSFAIATIVARASDNLPEEPFG